MDYFSDLEFVCSGKSRNATGVTRNRFFEYYGLQFIRNGKIYVKCSDRSWLASGPVLFVTGPEREFTYYTPEGGREHFYVCFSGERARRYRESGLLPPIGEKILITREAEFTAVMDEIIRLLRLKDQVSHGRAVLLLEQALLLAAHQPAPRQSGTFNQELIREAAEKIAEHPEQEWDFAGLSAEYGLSEVHFRRLFRKVTGYSPHRYILEQRIRYAAHLLRTTDMFVKEIAFASGFGGEFYFSRQFRRIMKQSPTGFRNNI